MKNTANKPKKSVGENTMEADGGGSLKTPNNDGGTRRAELMAIETLDLSGKIYEIRSEKVMLDFDLAEIYGYTTKAFNQQVSRNIEKFEGEEFMFKVTRAELDEILTSQTITLDNEEMEVNDLVRSQNVTSRTARLFSGQSGGSRYLPYAFTEQGVYMLMTVLRGELAVRQSRALVMAFKRMKDYIVENHEALEYKHNLQMVLQVAENTAGLKLVRDEVKKIDDEAKTEFAKVNKEVENISNKMSEVVLKSDLSPVLLKFSTAIEREEFLIREGELARANEAYIDIYTTAQKNIYIIDNYISIKTLRQLQKVHKDVEITVFSDNLGHYLHKSDYDEFKKEFPDLKVKFLQNSGQIHDRFIVIDLGYEAERVYHCGASAKDAGAKLTVIYEFEQDSLVKNVLKQVLGGMMGNRELRLKS